MAVHDADTMSTSFRKATSPSGAEVRRRRCSSRECHEVSFCVFPRERQAGRRAWTPSWPQMRRNRASGHRRGLVSAASASDSSSSLWHPQVSQSCLYRATVSSLKSSGRATSCSICFARACKSTTRGCPIGSPPWSPGSRNGAPG